jgi:hypothetical protein
MRRRLLNIASIVCFVMCVALMGMWVRSYYYWSNWEIKTNSGLLQLGLDRGLISYTGLHPIASQADVIALLKDIPQGITFVTAPVDPTTDAAFRATSRGFAFYRQTWGIDAYAPIWSLILVFAGISSLPLLPYARRFTLRSLFIAMTFLAMVLGMIAWLDPSWIGK